jgi:hypothetical protein
MAVLPTLSGADRSEKLRKTDLRTHVAEGGGAVRRRAAFSGGLGERPWAGKLTVAA